MLVKRKHPLVHYHQDEVDVRSVSNLRRGFGRTKIAARHG
ncbi:Uncharacterised protein [Vibrio cholerae]|nr:Uncharacterised protein [Vibrio cholerae]